VVAVATVVVAVELVVMVATIGTAICAEWKSVAT
jgi:hypothetical protein